MLKPQIHNRSQSVKAGLFPLNRQPNFLHRNSHHALPPVQSRLKSISFNKLANKVHCWFVPGNNIKSTSSPSSQMTSHDGSTTVKAVVTVRKGIVGGLLSKLGINQVLDKVKDNLGRTLILELVSTDLDPKTGTEKGTIKGAVHQTGEDGKDYMKYESEFDVPTDFGEVGAVLVENGHHKEMFLKEIVLHGFDDNGSEVTITCDSWVHSKYDNKDKRIFFTNKSYLPSQTPEGLKRLRKEELANLRGNGLGERKSSDRVYDYDVYNDIGNPDADFDLARPVLGGQQHPYPRRCRTGRPRCNTDPLSEKRSANIYVPRDEAFSDVKELTFTGKTISSVLNALVPSLSTAIVDVDLGFPDFTSIESLFNEGVDLPDPFKGQGFWKTLLPRLVKTIADTTQDVLHFETPETVARDRFFWLRDEEFARQTLAGTNPYSIQLLTEWPLKSTLDFEIYGPPESKITNEIIEREIIGFMTIDEAIKQKKLFMLDYHDLLLPYVKKVREIDNTTLYGSRTLFFLTPDGTLRPLAIELTRPPLDGKPQWKQVFTPNWNSTESWLWKLAKAHVLAHDSCYHELVSHWLRTHCATEPYIIATNRQLSVMHPIYRLLHPHFRYTMEINALARSALISAEGIIETSFSPAKYSMELSSTAYEKQWRFDYQALPKDLISRGMAVEDPDSPHGLKLAIEDYPFANDGLIVWDAINQWVSEYVNHYYPDRRLIELDQELQAWWSEIRNVGHGDKKDEPWWPVLETPENLVEIITIVVWVASAHHAAVNFGQYAYGGYFPNRPSIARIKMPTEDPLDEDWNSFINKPEDVLLKCFPSQVQASLVMAILDVLSNHSPDEEYLGEMMEPSWGQDPVVKAAFKRFNEKLKELEQIVDDRNGNKNLKNRNGAGTVPYELLKPFSESGVTGKGIPYSISI